MKPLTVYKASAGSGKTFTLAVEYIKLLIDNPLCFKNILAVTFTNKATEEMKLRILSQLYGIWKMLPDSRVYIKAVCEGLSIDERMASKQAGLALNYLIHNYHYFRVETIDSFFQSILRNLARELDLTANLKIGLNDIQVEEEAVDQLIESLDSTSIMLEWLISYIFSNISENKSWNVIGQVKNFGRTIFRDFYKTIGEELSATISQNDFFKNYTNCLKTIQTNAKKRMAEYAVTFERETANAGLTPLSYAKKGNGISSYFNKLKSDDFSDSRCINTVFRNCYDNAESWTSKTSPDRDVIVSLVNDKLLNLLHEAENERKKQWKLYSTAGCTLRHLDKLRLLNRIENKVRQLNGEANRFLLSDTQFLLHTLIKDNDSPFIFEKAGCSLEHIMIDEFQDTSSIQWQNFKVLLNECMSHYGDGKNDNLEGKNLTHNLIVGDVKQSIYRWRSGDWRLLNGIESQFDRPESKVDIKNLQVNYRSERNIIKFNNIFFTLAAKYEYNKECEINDESTSNELLTAYSDVCQHANSDKKAEGMVKIKLLTDDEYEGNMLALIDETIEKLLSAGISANNIAILIRYNRHIPIIADYLMEKHPDLKIVSDEAFRLDASLAVNTIIQALSLILHPDDILSKANLAVTYQKKILGTEISISDILSEIKRGNKGIDYLLPATFTECIAELAKMPLFEIVEYIYSSFQLSKLNNQSAYICAFYDQISEFITGNSGNIAKFMEEWNDSICNKTIQSDEINGIRIISIHKSKGLEFDNVIIPFCDWALENRDTTLWCKPDEYPFNLLPIVPVDYSKKLLETIYSKDYKNEHIQNKVDNLNLLYVAFTRASKNLFIYGRKNGTRGGLGCRSEIISECIDSLAESLEGAVVDGKENKDSSSSEPVTFTYGTLCASMKTVKESVSENVFLTRIQQQRIEIKTSDVPVKFRQSNKSLDFIANNEDNKDDDNYIKTGNILHKLFSTIRTTDDIANALKQLEYEGILYDDHITAEKMSDLLNIRLSDKKISDWFDRRWNVFNECSILSYDNATGKVCERRPDRVITDGNETKVIDFKFGKPRDEYKQQVQQYIHLLESMGYNNVKGYLWYVYSNEIDEVNAC